MRGLSDRRADLTLMPKQIVLQRLPRLPASNGRQCALSWPASDRPSHLGLRGHGVFQRHHLRIWWRAGWSERPGIIAPRFACGSAVRVEICRCALAWRVFVVV
jgi:hypothetical protein